MVFVEILKRFLGTTVLWFSYYQTIYTCDFDYKLRVDLTVQILLQVLLLLHLLKQDNFIIGMKYEHFYQPPVLAILQGRTTLLSYMRKKKDKRNDRYIKHVFGLAYRYAKNFPFVGYFQVSLEKQLKSNFSIDRGTPGFHRDLPCKVKMNTGSLLREKAFEAYFYSPSLSYIRISRCSRFPTLHYWYLIDIWSIQSLLFIVQRRDIYSIAM